jgi:excinuclease UvrABC ATPase subunit
MTLKIVSKEAIRCERCSGRGTIPMWIHGKRNPRIDVPCGECGGGGGKCTIVVVENRKEEGGE